MCCGDRMIESGIKKGVTRGLWQRRSNRKSILTDNFLFYRFIHENVNMRDCKKQEFSPYGSSLELLRGKRPLNKNISKGSLNLNTPFLKRWSGEDETQRGLILHVNAMGVPEYCIDNNIVYFSYSSYLPSQTSTAACL